MYLRWFLLLVLLNFGATERSEAAGPTQQAGEHPHRQCRNCHRSSEIQQTGSQSSEFAPKNSCVGCHREILGSNGDASSSAGYATSGHMADAISTEQKSAPLGGKAMGRMECVSCHAPHDQGQPKLLRSISEATNFAAGATFDPATKLCLSCHPVAADFRGIGRGYMRHPVGIPVTKTGRILDRSRLPPLWDVRGTADPSDDVIGCTTCHYPHASKNSFLLRWSLAEMSAACLQCHPDVSPSAPGETKGLVARR